MKQTESSNAPVPINNAFSETRENAPVSQPSTLHKSIRTRYVIAILCLALIITVCIFAYKIFSSNTTISDIVSPSNVKALEVEVLDGVGSTKAAQQVVNILRSMGYDVVEMKRNNGIMVERTYVIDHSGKLDAARQIAASLGIPQDKVFQKIDRNLYLDITIMVGKDISHLKAIQSLTERSRH